MSVKHRIVDGEGSNIEAGVTQDHALKVSVVPQSTKEIIEGGGTDLLVRTKYLAEYLTDSAGSNDLNVDGATTVTDFFIGSEVGKVKTIYEVRFILEDTQMDLGTAEGKRFASAANNGLTNGLKFFVSQQGTDTDIFARPVTNIASFLNYSSNFVNEAGSLGAGIDLLVVTINFPNPIVIVEGQLDKITVRIQDNVSALNLFNVLGIGTQELF